MDLLFLGNVIGYIDILSKEDFWIYGKIRLNKTVKTMQFFLAQSYVKKDLMKLNWPSKARDASCP